VTQGVSASSFLKNIENTAEDRERMYMEDSVIGLEEESHLSKMLQSKLNKLKEELLDFCLLKDKVSDDIDPTLAPTCANIILFGPTGSGKSSVIRTIYSGLHGVFNLPPELQEQLVIKKHFNNEGTVKFTKVQIKKPQKNILTAGGTTYEYKQSGINMFDTRGQILLDDKETEAMNIMIDVRRKRLTPGSSQSKFQNCEQNLSLLIYAVRVLEEGC